MARTDNDSWEITESVGSTALGVAAARAAETDSDEPADPGSVRPGISGRGRSRHVELDVGSRAVGRADRPGSGPRRARQVMVDFMAVRTKWFDELFLDAVSSGIRQVVILASGLDSRSWRLPWPDGTTVYELDQAKVLEFKSSTLRTTARSRPRIW